jgi:hypothetical protein
MVCRGLAISTRQGIYAANRSNESQSTKHVRCFRWIDRSWEDRYCRDY